MGERIDPGRAADSSRRYEEIRRRTEELCETLSPEDCVGQSMPDASPTKWHLAHATWFFEVFVLEPLLPGYRPFDSTFRFLFNSYYNAVGEQYPRPRRGLLTRPPLEQVFEYRSYVDKRVLGCLDGEAPDTLASVVELGLHHEQQHQELILTDIKHLFSCSPLRPGYKDTPAPRSAPAEPLHWHAYPEGVYEIGHSGSGFGFDNESPRHRVFTEAFELGSRPITNGEYLEFMRDGGYTRADLWLSAGWEVVRRERWEAPLYWEGGGDGWALMTLGGLRDLQPEQPLCHVSYFEADAFARWAGARLPCEAEWELAAAEVPVGGNLAETGLLHPAAGSGGAAAPIQLFGDVWEWSRSAYAAYPGYQPTAGALGEYNAKFMSNQMVLRGGSCATPASHVRATYRNFFLPDARWQFSGIRLARDAG
ncbi:MAG: ergothioneine biosynthesis protein EgtB [Myxococcota bacterium]